MNATPIPELTQFEQAYLSMPNQCTLCKAASVSRFALVSKNPALDGLLILFTCCDACAAKPTDTADAIEARLLKGAN